MQVEQTLGLLEQTLVEQTSVGEYILKQGLVPVSHLRKNSKRSNAHADRGNESLNIHRDYCRVSSAATYRREERPLDADRRESLRGTIKSVTSDVHLVRTTD